MLFDLGNRDIPSDPALVRVAEAEVRCAGAPILGQAYSQNLDHTPSSILT